MKNDLLSYFFENSKYKKIINNIAANPGCEIKAASQTVKHIMTAALHEYQCKNLFIIVQTVRDAENYVDALKKILPDKNICLLPIMEVMAYDILARNSDAVTGRMQAISIITSGDPYIVVAPVRALMNAMVPPDIFSSNSINIKMGNHYDIYELLEKLTANGYVLEALVEAKGQFSHRGAIVDIFSPNMENPVRIEFFDDEVDSLREFDPVTQRSHTKLEEIVISVARDSYFDSSSVEDTINSIRDSLEKRKSILIDEQQFEHAENIENKIKKLINFSDEGAFSADFLSQYLPFFYQKQYSIFDYFSDVMVIADDYKQCLRDYDMSYQEMQVLLDELMIQGQALPEQGGLYISTGKISDYLQPEKVTDFTPFQALENDSLLDLHVENISDYHLSHDFLARELSDAAKNNYEIILVGDTEDFLSVIDNLIEEHLEEKISYKYIKSHITKGFRDRDAGLLVLSQNDFIFTRKVRKGKHSSIFNPEKALKSINDLKNGDFVVHIKHGIGVYHGIVNMEAGGVRRDYIFIKYSGEDKLYVPLDQMQYLQKYYGDEDNPPKINRLGGDQWTKIRAKTKKSVEIMAKELLELYANRNEVVGHAFAEDSYWQMEFEEQFPYEETPDQLKVIDEIKLDMENDIPMDRLLCGDVGYGKTEVALRAAFKAVQDSKQVAVLVPTTILAHQHFKTFTDRFEKYPIKVEVLSRLRSASDVKKITQQVALGEVDVIIGTHKILQSKLEFRDLGLLVIDEEQRFGVKQKEKIKQLRNSIDVLTLSATPIPRTLYMSLTGLRDISLIETPPQNRFPVQTYVLEHNWDLVRDIIRREVSRGGQIYYVYNRIKDIQITAMRIRKMLPNITVAVMHAQLTDNEIEDVMNDFVQGKIDLLLATTIIENGLDIPNVNTLIIENADHMGLSQLYQLRGRVGRSNRLAYSYFTYKQDKVLTEVSRKRLEAIQEFTEFGSGFKIAMRDLEIRGAGNILGGEQHGHIVSVGYEMYCQLLEEAINELKGSPKAEVLDPSIEISIDAYIPDTYIQDEKQKIDVYRRMSAISGYSGLTDLQEELRDRYGEIPDETHSLFKYMKLKLLAKELRVETVKFYHNRIVFEFKDMSIFSEHVVLKIIKDYAKDVRYHPDQAGVMTYNLPRGADSMKKLAICYNFLVYLKKNILDGGNHAE